MTTDMSTDDGQAQGGQGWARRTAASGAGLWLPGSTAPTPTTGPGPDTPSTGHLDRPRWAGVRAAPSALLIWVFAHGWLTVSAWLLTFTCLGCALLDSYTSQCVIGGTVGHIGQASACPGFDGWDTRVFPIAVDAGWAGALFALLRLARSIGMRDWRWRAVFAFELLTAAVTVAGNAFHGLVLDGAAVHFPTAANLVVGAVASAVPGIVAVGSGFTLSVLVAAEHLDRASAADEPKPDAVVDAPSVQPEPAPVAVTVERAPDGWTGVRSADGWWWWDGARWCPVVPPTSAPDTRPRPPLHLVDGGPDEPSEDAEREGADAVSAAARRATADRPSTEAVAERVAVIVAYLRAQADAGRDPADVGVSELSKETGIPRGTIYRLRADALSTFRPEPARAGEGVAA